MKKLKIHNSNLYDIFRINVKAYDDRAHKNSVASNSSCMLVYLTLVSPPISAYSIKLKFTINELFRRSFKSISSQKTK